MDKLIEFLNVYEKLKSQHPELYFSISQTRKNDLWRVKVFAYNLADRGDAELVSSESASKDEALEKAINKMLSIPLKIDALTEFKTSSHRLFRSSAAV